MRVEMYGVPVVCGKPFGLEKGGNLGNIGVTASSSSDNSHDASDGRLYGDASWCSSTSSNSEYIQIDFGKMATLTGIATQGDHTDDKWVKTYILKYSFDGIQWNDYKEGGNNAKVFQGNSNKSGIVVRWLNRPTTVRNIKVHPQTWNSDICMRLELFGCSSPSTLKISELSNKNLTASSGSHVTLTCKVQEPLVQSIEWLSDGKVATHLSGGIERDATSTKSSLLVNYTSAAEVLANTRCSKEAKFVICRRNIVCKVRYTKDSNSKESIQGAEVQIRLDYPSAPSLTTVSNKLTDSVEINWTGNIKDSQPVDRFLIKYWNHESTNTVNVKKTLITYKVTGLLACTYYDVSIKAVGALGEGPWSKTLNFRTESELPKPPSNVTVTKKTSQSILVKWQVPAGIRCPPNGSRISFSTSKGGAWTTKIVRGGQTTSYNIQSLSKWTDYYIKVEVGNEKGYSSPSLPIKEQPDAPPTNFKATAVSSTSIRLTWGLPAIGKRNGVIKGFRISYCKINDCPTRIAKQLRNNSTLTHVFDKLDMFTKYSFKILAYTSEGNGPYSKDVIMMTDEGPPSKPLNIETVDIAPDGSFGPRLRVSWDVPSPLNGKYIRKYSVSYKADGMNVVDNTLNDNKTTTILNVCGGVNYVINVWARTVSDGEKAKKDVTTNTYAPMNVPSGLKSHEHNTSTFNISWLPIPSTEGRILVYELSVLRFNSTARLSNLQTFINVTCPEVACRGSARHRCSHVLHNLPQCAKFNLSVRAYTDKGHGKLTEDFTLETSVPGPSRELKTENIGKNSVRLTWLEPQPLSKPVLKYTIKYFGEKEYDFDGEKTFDGEEETKMTSLTIT
ncbi:receptor-type tyrosine-protein phosphatase F, partial [Exaiptasia diaphana]|uniref:Uncharacterized protein n=1 Tax=Exaiptasia diaphana TaxID=2652724 RepID=A0A913XY64_EXADI